MNCFASNAFMIGKEMAHFLLRMMNKTPYPLQNSIVKGRSEYAGCWLHDCVVSVNMVPHSPAVTLPAPAPGHQCLQSLEMMTRHSSSSSHCTRTCSQLTGAGQD